MISGQLMQVWTRLVHRHENGQALTEYGLILALVALVGVVGLITLSNGTGTLYDSLNAIADALLGKV